ncbi:hypothetical protein JCM10450v2_001737 [Rhodotorula kratochvilovae]
MLHLSALASVALVALSLRSASAWRVPGVEQRYVDETLIDAGALGFPNTGIVAAFADYNADGLVDVVHLSADQRSLGIYTWDRKKYSWTEALEARIRTHSDFIVTNVVPGDFNYDGRLDLLVMGGQNPGGWWGGDEDTDMQVYLQHADGSFGEPQRVDPSALAQAMPLDATGTMRTDLLGFAPGAKTPQLWKNVWEDSNRTSVFELSDAPLNLTTSPTGTFACRFPSPHFNAFIDLDGDCLADLFFTCQNGDDAEDLSYQIWVNKKDRGFEYAREGKLPKGIKSVGFADMDRDGTIDMVITSCTSSHTCALSIAYNAQIPLCDSSVPDSQACRDPEALCVADPSFAFDLSSSSNGAMTTIPLSALLPGHELVTSSSAYRGAYPVAPQIGDYNIDGYPDLLVVAQKGRDRLAYVLQSRQCEKGACSASEIEMRRRAFRVVSEGADALGKIKDVESASWFDIADDGSLDILVQRLGNSGAARTPVFIKNNYFHDAFFLKAEMLNGACPGWCEPREAGEKRYRPFGASSPGASFKFTVLDPTGARRSTQYGQLAQSTYSSLLTPYSYFGLGRTNNYVENLFLGSTLHQPQHWLNAEGLIPNSQVLIMPHQPPGAHSPDSWSRMMFLRPGEWVPWVSVVLVGAIAALAAVVVALHVREKREDEAERRARLLHLNFQAL